MSEIHDALKHLSYDPVVGEIKRLTRKNSNGSFDKDGYLILKIKGKQWKAHRLAWAMFYGHLPLKNIDHINGNKTDNRIINLRDVSQSKNNKNAHKKPNKDTGFVGIHLDRKTKGLLAKYTTKFNCKQHRFKKLKDAVQFRNERGLAI